MSINRHPILNPGLLPRKPSSQPSRPGTIIQRPNRRPRTPPRRNLNQPPKNRKLKPQLDTIRHRLKHNLQRKQPRILKDHNHNIQQEDDDIDRKELRENDLVRALRPQPQQLERFPDVDRREEALLQTEDDELDALDDRVPVHKHAARMAGGPHGAVHEHGRGDLHADCVGDDGVEDPAQEARAVQDQVQARPEHDRVARYHAVGGQVREEEEGEADGVDDQAAGGDE
ncbi:uncharacterized protein DSM5745_09434 [Aspergillus mulundensis]|uniref:Uncharacterized protein n=1 Tax=Aspergillus mulundensis TaxID=1810919 RepID=A0A3D8QV95_9EURO|nr:hypothetical protein DSM5745_09434 [Aspergillus mulundensis]RDW65695.1 hypothetical protein DSM5745_09434 [Aspergillus mulundensis]